MVTFAAVQEAKDRISPHIIRTPLVFSPTFSERTGARVYLKLETFQKAGSFKVRGATNKILRNLDIAGKYGVVAASAGNHAQGVAVAARNADVAATIVMPVWASLVKQEATKSYGARIVLHGQTLEESVAYAESLARNGMLFVHPYDDDEVIAGQGTVGLEILEDLPEMDVVVVPVGGGGLIAGIATATKALRPSCRIIGVQSESCPSAFEALRTGKPVCVIPKPTLADGIRVAQPGLATLPVIMERVERIAIVGEDAIADAVLSLIERKKVIAEGAGATPLAALLSGAVEVKGGSTVVLVISGGNIDTPLLERAIRRALVLRGRILQCRVTIGDASGTLARMLAVVAREGGNITHIHHEAGAMDVPVQSVRVLLEIETRGPDHIRSIVAALEGGGYRTDLTE
ncbi:MAG: Threonine synthase [Methanoregula sp. PtaU1.Bin051]|nr:MAG: Threonine synthase [Methanoregula sp. PtaU1.Bin051]